MWNYTNRVKLKLNIKLFATLFSIYTLAFSYASKLLAATGVRGTQILEVRTPQSTHQLQKPGVESGPSSPSHLTQPTPQRITCLRYRPTRKEGGFCSE
ncbi:hypothetical protein HDV63DRAFT_104819 [Trichoderma sp. SZMC 28014]